MDDPMQLNDNNKSSRASTLLASLTGDEDTLSPAIIPEADSAISSDSLPSTLNAGVSEKSKIGSPNRAADILASLTKNEQEESAPTPSNLPNSPPPNPPTSPPPVPPPRPPVSTDTGSTTASPFSKQENAKKDDQFNDNLNKDSDNTQEPNAATTNPLFQEDTTSASSQSNAKKLSVDSLLNDLVDVDNKPSTDICLNNELDVTPTLFSEPSIEEPQKTTTDTPMDPVSVEEITKKPSLDSLLTMEKENETDDKFDVCNNNVSTNESHKEERNISKVESQTKSKSLFGDDDDDSKAITKENSNALFGDDDDDDDDVAPNKPSNSLFGNYDNENEDGKQLVTSDQSNSLFGDIVDDPITPSDPKPSKVVDPSGRIVPPLIEKYNSLSVSTTDLSARSSPQQNSSSPTSLNKNKDTTPEPITLQEQDKLFDIETKAHGNENSNFVEENDNLEGINDDSSDDSSDDSLGDGGLLRSLSISKKMDKKEVITKKIDKNVEEAATTLFESIVPPIEVSTKKDKSKEASLQSLAEIEIDNKSSLFGDSNETLILHNNESVPNREALPQPHSQEELPRTKASNLAESGLFAELGKNNADFLPSFEQKSTSSKKVNSLAESGLLFPSESESCGMDRLGMDLVSGVGDDGGGGLFDEIDAEEERQRVEEERKRQEEERRQIEEERRRKEAEERRKRELEEAERKRKDELLRQQEEIKRRAEERKKREEAEGQRREEEVKRRREMESFAQKSATVAASNAMNQVQNMYNQSSAQAGQKIPAPPSSFYRTHEPRILMDDPLSNLTNNNQPSNMTGRYNESNSRTSPLQSPSSVHMQHQEKNIPTSPYQPTQAQIPNANVQQSPGQDGLSFQEQNRLRYGNVQSPSKLAGMYNSKSPQRTPRKIPEASNFTLFKTPVPTFDPIYGDIVVDDPRLMSSSGLFGSSPPHWTYNVSTLPKQGHSGSVIVVRRRFRHFVALEDRLRDACLGSILPPRPDKHEGRLIEEGLQQQSPAFAAARALELQTYLNNLSNHPQAGKSEPLRLFLTLQDHIGNAWPEVSNNALTRLSRVGTNAAVKVAESTNNAIVLNQFVAEMGEENAELIAIATSEHLRLTAVVQSVIKIEGFIHQIREYADRTMFAGLESSKLCSNYLQERHPDLYIPLSLLATGQMKSGKRSKHLSLELSAAFGPFIMEYRQVNNERIAFNDRRTMLLRREAARAKAAEKSSKFLMQQRHLQMHGQTMAMERLQYEAASADSAFTETSKETEEVGKILASEVARLTQKRRKEWMASLKIMASGFKEASAERCATWMTLKKELSQMLPAKVDEYVPSPAVLRGGNIPNTATMPAPGITYNNGQGTGFIPSRVDNSGNIPTTATIPSTGTMYNSGQAKGYSPASRMDNNGNAPTMATLPASGTMYNHGQNVGYGPASRMDNIGNVSTMATPGAMYNNTQNAVYNTASRMDNSGNVQTMATVATMQATGTMYSNAQSVGYNTASRMEDRGTVVSIHGNNSMMR